ncbi:IclR family transcriptional regulator [Ruegeria marisrubri]|uniref:IclR family transcriptional regulator n=1 Tax=Ruegeria marisrubri TaxID=1685379 RepID=A0A0X3TLF9_9RHOB|nr:IclR family transcriptional regulator [Ruegeria marisrubri]KUJ76499.1 IclR family transcriptional regulator [Ruegeria marisrubri]
MSVVEKAIGLLNHFSTARPEIGLSEFCRLARRDKATTYRHLTALEAVGLVEQNPTTRAYRIGPAALRLAELREATVPRRDGVLQPLATLADRTGESAHVSVLSGSSLHSLAVHESTRHSTRVVIDVAILPLHATASGISAVAFGAPELRDAALANMNRFTDFTPTTPEALDAAVAEARRTGISTSDSGFEAGVHGMAAPIYDQSGALAGAVAVASVATRMTAEQEFTNRTALVEAARQITRNWGGTVPAVVEAAWADTLTPMPREDAAR